MYIYYVCVSVWEVREKGGAELGMMRHRHSLKLVKTERENSLTHEDNTEEYAA